MTMGTSDLARAYIERVAAEQITRGKVVLDYIALNSNRSKAHDLVFDTRTYEITNLWEKEKRHVSPNPNQVASHGYISEPLKLSACTMTALEPEDKGYYGRLYVKIGDTKVEPIKFRLSKKRTELPVASLNYTPLNGRIWLEIKIESGSKGYNVAQICISQDCTIDYKQSIKRDWKTGRPVAMKSSDLATVV